MGTELPHRQTFRSCTSLHDEAGAVARPSLRETAGWCGAAIAGLILGQAALQTIPFGPFARHMGQHILLMNVVAPLIAVVFVKSGRMRALVSSRFLVIATVVQLSLLWGWHAPVSLDFAHRSPLFHALMQISLLATALWFWLAIISDRSAFRWRAVFALLITGKLFCLLGVLLVFAPRLIYGGYGHQPSGHFEHLVASVDALADQHLGGLMMVVACPLTYVLAGVVIAAQGLRDLARTSTLHDGVSSPLNTLKTWQ